MDIHLDSLLMLPNVSVFTCYQKEGFIFLELELINQGINCPHCQTYTDNLHHNRPIFVDREYISKFLVVNLIVLTVKKFHS
jgi:hypothetical protein